MFLNPIKWHPGKEISNFLSFGDSWDGIGTVVSGYWGSSIGGGSYWGSGYGSWGSSKSVSVSSMGIWISISSIVVSWSNNVASRGGGDQSGEDSDLRQLE